MERYRSGQTGQTVNLLAIAFVGSTPTLSTICRIGGIGIRRRLKISRPNGLAGSTPASDTIFLNLPLGAQSYQMSGSIWLMGKDE